MSGFLIRILAWTKLAQAKLWLSHCIFNCSNHVYNSNFIVFSCANIQHCMNNISPSHFTVAPMWPKSYHTTGPKGTFLRHLVRYRTLSKTLIYVWTLILLECLFGLPSICMSFTVFVYCINVPVLYLCTYLVGCRQRLKLLFKVTGYRRYQNKIIITDYVIYLCRFTGGYNFLYKKTSSQLAGSWNTY